MGKNKKSSRKRRKVDYSLSRREVIKLGGAVAIATSANGLGSATNASEKNTSKTAGKTVDYDVIIVGGGFAGVTAARDLSRLGRRVLLLEARNRLGGRTFVSKFADHDVELGGTWISWHEPHIWAEVTRYQAPINETPGMAVPAFLGWMTKHGALTLTSSDQLGALLEGGISKLVAGAENVFPRPYEPFFTDDYKKWDKLSVQARLDQIELSESELELTRALYNLAYHNPDSKAGGLIEMIRMYSLVGGAAQLVEAGGRYKLRDGTRSLINAMAEDGEFEVQLNAPVSKVTLMPNKVTIVTEHEEVYTSRAVVMAVPVNTVGNIDFEPALSAGKLAMFNERHTGSGLKTYIKLNEQMDHFSIMGADDNPFNNLVTEYSGPDGTILIGMCANPQAYDANDDRSVEQAVRKYLPAAVVAESYTYDWNLDPYSLGTWCMYRPGQMTKYLKELQRPTGRVFFAGSDIANGWRGFIDGAVETGLRTATDVHRFLA